MSMRICAASVAVLVFLCAAVPANAQSGKARAGAEIDLKARLKVVQASPPQLEGVLKAGAKVASFCANCHGEGGNSVKTDVPNLAGQNAGYLLDQLQSYIEGRRHTSEFKQRLIKVLSPDEKLSLVAFYARQNVQHKPVADVALVGNGQLLYKKYCTDCHESDGRGSEAFSRVAGQQAGYLTAAIKSYRDSPIPRLSRNMVASIRGMSDADIAALVAYIASMQ